MTISLHKDMFHNKVHNKVHNYNFSVVFALLPIICTKRFFATVYTLTLMTFMHVIQSQFIKTNSNLFQIFFNPYNSKQYEVVWEQLVG